MLIHSNVTDVIIGAALKVHRELGPGLLKSAYGACLRHEFQEAGLRYEAQVRLPVIYRDVHVDAGYRLDFAAEGDVVVEIKAVEVILPLHRAQLLSYLRLSKLPVGLLLNFNVSRMVHGIHRMVLTPRV